ncbi:MAG TPA: molecular chaperone HtpG, partial [Porphyromonadaceae bacterium]|nr:molecular chaperone HtpG [Porphyromonadaceae bacterium]
EILTLSYKEGAKAVRWTCDGSPEYTLEETEKAERGTDIILHIDEENKNFLEKDTIEGLLKKYCKFLPIPVVFGKKQEWKDGKYVDTAEDNQINETQPAWVKKPADLKEEDYRDFYHSLYPMHEEPLFWIHLNVDYPFHLTGILYFPKVSSTFEMVKNKIQLYCNQVYVTDSVEGIVPEFLTLLHGVIDSPDIPLNVSRSYLQSDSNVKKISSHITKKVSDRLLEIFKEDRKTFEKKWDDIKAFIEYGVLTDEKFYERAEKFALFKNTENAYYTFEEYRKLIGENQKNKSGETIYLYATNKETQYNYIESARNAGYDVLLMDSPLSSHYMQTLEQKFEKSHFVRVDSDTISKLIVKEDKPTVKLTEIEEDSIKETFDCILPKGDKMDFRVSFEAMGENSYPLLITQSEYMRRMKEMAAMNAGFNFYGQMPDSYNLVLNTDHALIKQIFAEEKEKFGESLEKLFSSIREIEKKNSDLQGKHSKMKSEEIPSEEKEEIDANYKELDKLRAERKEILSNYAKENTTLKQMVDIALLSNGLLKGEAMSNFIKRSYDVL